jgi:pyruvate carboxylase
LSENVAFARACRDAGVTFIGPSPEVLEIFGDKTQARNLAIECGVPVIPGTTDPCLNVDDARKQIADMGGLPVMLKAVHGGGGRGMRVVLFILYTFIYIYLFNFFFF